MENSDDITFNEHISTNMHRIRIEILLSMGVFLAGCGPTAKTYPEKAPVPVSVMKLVRTTPKAHRTYTGSVRSWKVEDIAFEVEGRVTWVVEPGAKIEGRTYGVDGELLSPGTQIAQLDRERFLSALGSAKAKVTIETLTRDSIQLQIEQSIPAELRAANGQLSLAKTEFDRNERLVAQNAGSRKNLDAAKAKLDAAQADLDGVNAKLLQLMAELKSAEAAITKAQLAQQDAETNLEDTELYSAYSGQVAAIHVVPGSLTGAQSVVATVQMMNPIKVETEVSAELSRKIRPGDVIPVSVAIAKDEIENLEASVYSISPSADNDTRTFTLTLLIANREHKQDSNVGASTTNLWRAGLGILPLTAPGIYYMPEDGIHTDEKGSYVWRITNFKAGEPMQRALKVAKLYVIPSETSTPFLGKTRFRTFTVPAGEVFDPEQDLLAENLIINGEPSHVELASDSIQLQRGNRWLLRPGDLVQINLAPQSSEKGLFVPIEAIHENSGKTAVFVLDENGETRTVKEVEVNVVNDTNDPASSLQQIVAVSEKDILQGVNVVVEGVHYLNDGQKVVVAAVESEKQ